MNQLNDSDRLTHSLSLLHQTWGMLPRKTKDRFQARFAQILNDLRSELTEAQTFEAPSAKAKMATSARGQHIKSALKEVIGHLTLPGQIDALNILLSPNAGESRNTYLRLISQHCQRNRCITPSEFEVGEIAWVLLLETREELATRLAAEAKATA